MLALGTGPAPGSTLTVLDLVAHRAARTIDLAGYTRPHGVAWLPDGRRVVVTSEASQTLLIVDVAAGTVERTIRTGVAGTHMVVVSRDGARAWTANIGGGSVSLLDLTTGTLLKTTVTGRGPEAIDLSPSGMEVWTADRSLNRITVLDASTMDTLASMPTGGDVPNRLKFTPDGKLVLLSNARTGVVAIFDASRRTQVGEIRFPVDPAMLRAPPLPSAVPVSATPLGIVIHPSGTRAWVALAAIDRIAEIDISKRTVVRLLQAGHEPDGMALVRRAATY